MCCINNKTLVVKIYSTLWFLSAQIIYCNQFSAIDLYTGWSWYISKVFSYLHLFMKVFTRKRPEAEHAIIKISNKKNRLGTHLTIIFVSNSKIKNRFPAVISSRHNLKTRDSVWNAFYSPTSKVLFRLLCHNCHWKVPLAVFLPHVPWSRAEICHYSDNTVCLRAGTVRRDSDGTKLDFVVIDIEVLICFCVVVSNIMGEI